MLLSEDKVVQILYELHRKTISREVRWNPTTGNAFFVVLPNGFYIVISQQPGDSYRLHVLKNQDTIGELDFSKMAGNYAVAESIYQEAKRSASEEIAGKIIGSLQKPGIIGRDISSGVDYIGTGTITGNPNFINVTVPSFPTAPTEAMKDQFLNTIEGRWILDYGGGQERVLIDKQGHYTLEGETNPRFILHLLECNESVTRVEVGKDYLDGGRRQIEVLNIEPNSMIGYAKHDGHSLNYVRIR